MPLAVASVPSLAPTRSHAQVNDINDAVNKAGRMRTWPQRMAKCYAAVGQDVASKQADDVLGQAIGVFERHLVELRAFAPTPAIGQAFEAIDAGWTSFKTLLVGSKPNRANAQQVATIAERQTQLAQQATTLVEQRLDRPVASIVLLCGFQRTLSQRMASRFLLANWGVQSSELAAAIRRDRDAFVAAQTQLKAAPQTTPTIRTELDLAEQQFAFFQAALDSTRGSATPVALRDVFTTSERILTVMEKATGLYARLT
jgi:hypothetical protein